MCRRFFALRLLTFPPTVLRAACGAGLGAVGMAHAGPDTAGSRYFITLAPQPHLDGAYPLFGNVVEGLELLDRIVQGDEIVQVGLRS